MVQLFDFKFLKYIRYTVQWFSSHYFSLLIAVIHDFWIFIRKHTTVEYFLHILLQQELILSDNSCPWDTENRIKELLQILAVKVKSALRLFFTHIWSLVFSFVIAFLVTSSMMSTEALWVTFIVVDLWHIAIKWCTIVARDSKDGSPKLLWVILAILNICYTEHFLCKLTVSQTEKLLHGS